MPANNRNDLVTFRFTTALSGVILFGTLGSGVAQPVGIGACDNFLAAYAQCAAGAGVPEAARGPIQQGIEGMRTSFRESAARSAQARETIRAQCVTTHETVRARMIEAFRCDFPAASAMPAVADAPFVPAPVATPAVVADDPAAAAAKKANAYTKVQNDIVDSHPMAKELSEHIRNNERVLKLGTKLGANAWYLFGIGDFDRPIAELQAAMALPGSVPEVDPAAARLLAALETVNPVIKELYRYQKMRDFKEDGFKLAMAREKPLEDGMRGAMAASDAFSTALFERRMGIDEKRLAELKSGSLPYGMLGTSLKTRVLLRRYDAMEKPGDVAAFLAALDEVRASNKALVAVTEGLSPKVESACANYSEVLDSLIGRGRDLADRVKAKRDPSDESAAFAQEYNKSVDYYGRCLKGEARARG